MQNDSTVVLAASFAAEDGAFRAAGAITGAIPDRVANTAICRHTDAGRVKVFESADWGVKRGAALGGAVGLIAGPLGGLVGGATGAFVSKLRDRGFDNGQLERLTQGLPFGSSALLVELAPNAVKTASDLLDSLSAVQVRTSHSEVDVSTVFAGVSS